MFIVSFKLKSIKLLFILLAVIILTTIVVWGLVGVIINDISGVFTNKTEFNFINIKTNEERVNFLKQFGWEVNPKPIEIVEVKIPKEFDAVYENYNKLQSELGLNLRKYKGKRVKRYTYKILNHPQVANVEVRANILIYNNQVIAGDIMTTSLEGFMHSLLYNK